MQTVFYLVSTLIDTTIRAMKLKRMTTMQTAAYTTRKLINMMIRAIKLK